MKKSPMIEQNIRTDIDERYDEKAGRIQEKLLIAQFKTVKHIISH